MEELKQDTNDNTQENKDNILNTFSIPLAKKRVSVGLSFVFLNNEKSIELDLIVTALDIYSFEMNSINKHNKKMLKKSISNKTKNKTKNDDKLVHFKLDLIPENCHSLWFIVNACNENSLKEVDKAMFNIYENENNNNILYSNGIDIKCDSSAILLGVLVRNSKNKNQFNWTAIEDKNLENDSNISNLIRNNLEIIYDKKTIKQRPNDKNIEYKLKANDGYIIDKRIPKLQIGIGWVYTKNNIEREDGKKLIREFDIDIDIDVSIILFNNEEKEETCQEIVIVNNNNRFYKTCVEYRNESGHKLIDLDNKNEDMIAMNINEEIFDINLKKMNVNNDIGSFGVVLNVANDNNVKNQHKTNNIKNCYIRLIDMNNNKKELCRYTLSNVNNDKKTRACVLGYVKRSDNGSWTLNLNNIPLKTNSSVEYSEYAKEIILGTFEPTINANNKDSCCVIL